MEATKDKLPSCYGLYWDASAPECARCYAAPTCEGLTKARQESDDSAEEKAPENTEEKAPENTEEKAPENTEETSAGNEVDALDHLLTSLDGRYTREEKEAEGLRTVKFRNDKGSLIVRVIVSASGSVKAESSKGKVVLDSIDTIEQAEGVLHKILP